MEDIYGLIKHKPTGDFVKCVTINGNEHYSNTKNKYDGHIVHNADYTNIIGDYQNFYMQFDSQFTKLYPTSEFEFVEIEILIK